MATFFGFVGSEHEMREFTSPMKWLNPVISMKLKGQLFLPVLVLIFLPKSPLIARAAGTGVESSSRVPLQPFMDEVQRLQTALNFLGQPLAKQDQERIKSPFASQNTEAAVSQTEAMLDKYVLAVVTISAESRVDVKRGSASPDLVQDGTRLFLVKVVNQAGVTAPLAVESPNAARFISRQQAVRNRRTTSDFGRRSRAVGRYIPIQSAANAGRAPFGSSLGIPDTCYFQP